MPGDSPSAESTPPPRSIARLIEAPDAVTLAGLLAAFFSVMAAIERRFDLAAALLLAATVADFFDGKVARALGRRNHAFGAALDTVCDAVAFGAAPAVFGLCLGLGAPAGAAALAVFLAAAVLRLARFQASPREASHFTGMPVPYNNLVIAVAYFASSWGGLQSHLAVLLGALYLSLAALMLSTVRWPKF